MDSSDFKFACCWIIGLFVSAVTLAVCGSVVLGDYLNSGHFEKSECQLTGIYETTI